MFFMSACGHNYCRTCVRGHLDKLIDNCEVSKLKCLDYECRETFTEDEIRLVLPEESFIKMKRFLNALKVARDDNLFYCPNSTCEATLSKTELKSKASSKKTPYSCTTCSCEICKKCLLVSHEGKPCPD